MAYQHLFRPEPPGDPEGGVEPSDGEVYVFDDKVVLAVNVALVTGRTLLVRGAAGSGKSALAPNIARELGRPFVTQVVTSRTEAEDLLWHFDAVGRLSDASTGHAGPARDYYRKRVLWEAFSSDQPSVVLIDEIDKADPDLPNGLLAPLGSFAFAGPDGELVEASEQARPLVVVTTNNERALPRPFLRRCVVVSLEPPSKEHLLTVARAHFGTLVHAELVEAVADQVLAEQNGPDAPSTAEFLDAVRACHRLEIGPDSPEWLQLTSATLVKTGRDGS